MIEVPERVKDALRSGDYRKNYKITVPDMSVGAEPVSEVVVNYGDTGWTYLLMYNFDDQHHVIGYEETIWNNNFVFAEDYVRVDVRSDTYPFEELRFDGVWQDTVKFAGTATGTVFNVTAGDHGIVTRTATEDMTQPYSLPLHIICYGEKHTIDNDNLVAESVKFDERMCSDSELKFGLCEGTSVEFQYFGLANINGQRINIEIEIEYKDGNGDLAWHTIPMGWYTVESCSRQASTGIIKASAYNKLQSKYLDSVEDVKALIEAGESGVTGEISVKTLLHEMLEDYTIEEQTSSQVLDLLNYTIEAPPGESSPYQSVALEQYYDAGHYYYVYSVWFRVHGYTHPSDSFYRYTVESRYIYEDIASELGTRGKTIKRNGQGISIYDYGRTILAMTLCPVITVQAAVYSTSGELLFGVKRWGMEELAMFDYLTNNEGVYVSIPVYVDEGTSSTPPFVSPSVLDSKAAEYFPIVSGETTIREEIIPEIEKKRITAEDVGNSGITIRELQSAVFEMNCQYGKLDRTTDLFSGVTLNGEHIFPSDTLYPSDSLYPGGAAEAGFRSSYSKLWADEGNVRKFRYLIVTYKTTENGEDVDKKLQRTVNADGTDDYNMSNNWLFRNLVWTDVQVGAYADAMVLKMRDITWFPFEMWAPGLPYLEAGDEIEISTGDETHTSYILRRTLSGIQNLQDEMINGTLDIF